MSKYFNVFCLPNKQVNKYKTKIHIIYMLCHRAPCVPRPQWSPRNLNFVRPGTRSKELFVSFERSGEIITHSWRTLIQDRYKSNHTLSGWFLWQCADFSLIPSPCRHFVFVFVCVFVCDFAGQCESIFLAPASCSGGRRARLIWGRLSLLRAVASGQAGPRTCKQYKYKEIQILRVVASVSQLHWHKTIGKRHKYEETQTYLRSMWWNTNIYMRSMRKQKDEKLEAHKGI